MFADRRGYVEMFADQRLGFATARSNRHARKSVPPRTPGLHLPLPTKRCISEQPIDLLAPRLLSCWWRASFHTVVGADGMPGSFGE